MKDLFELFFCNSNLYHELKIFFLQNLQCKYLFYFAVIFFFLDFPSKKIFTAIRKGRV